MGKLIKKTWLIALPVLLLPVLCALAIFALPVQYGDTFLGVLSEKMDLLMQSNDKTRVIVVGGSGVAFGQCSDLLEEALPGYDVVNFGLYAGLGTSVMMDLSLPDVREGDIVILSPEQNAQTLSGFFGAKAMWQAADGHFSMLQRLQSEMRRAMLSEVAAFATDKAELWAKQIHLMGDGIYRRDAFNRWGDVTDEGREGNAMPGGFDPDMPIRFDESLVDPAFIEAMNAYAAACKAKGAQVFYRFCPMNAAAIASSELSRTKEYADFLRDALDFPLLGTPEESILDAEWFFDTNFHLNVSGAIVNTIEMARQLRKELGVSGVFDMTVPEKPVALTPAISGMDNNSDAACFLWTEQNGAAFITALTEDGRQRNELIIPSMLGGLPVTAFSHEVFAGNGLIRVVMLPATIRRIENDSFNGCTSLERVILKAENPNGVSVGDGLLNGTDCVVVVPADSFARYQTSYFWSVYASRIKPDRITQGTEKAGAMEADGRAGIMFADVNGGTPIRGDDTRIAFPISSLHLRTNTPLGQNLFERPGYAPLCWNTQPDGTGEDIPFGSRVDSVDGAVLYMRWLELTPEESFLWEERNGEACITGWLGETHALVIPRMLGGLPVTRIASGAFANAQVEMVVLPDTLFAIERQAFAGSTLRELWLYDALFYVYEDSFEHCERLETLHVSAATSPRYSTTYFAAFADKFDWLRQVKDDRKLVLAGGSATRYAYDSERFAEAFPAYVPVNMGVYAYTNMLPQLRIIERFLKKGDIILSTPEFDTTRTQFCPSNALDEMFWRMVEADYSCVSLLDMREYDAVFTSLAEYLQNRRMIPARAYEESPRRYDDDGNAVSYDTYNSYGDYTLHRPNGERDELLQSYRAAYTPEAFPDELIEALNRVYREFQAKDVEVLFAYAPRNHSALTPESTEEARRALHERLCEKLAAPVVIDIEDSLYSGVYCYLIDNHLSDSGVAMHMDKIIRAMRAGGWLEALDIPSGE